MAASQTTSTCGGKEDIIALGHILSGVRMVGPDLTILGIKSTEIPRLCERPVKVMSKDGEVEVKCGRQPYQTLPDGSVRCLVHSEKTKPCCALIYPPGGRGMPELCGRMAAPMPGGEEAYCYIHLNRKPSAQEKKEKKAKVPPLFTCTFVISRGDRKGQVCGKAATKDEVGEELCDRHRKHK